MAAVLPLLLLLRLAALLVLANTEGSCALRLASRHSPGFVLSACGGSFLLLLPLRREIMFARLSRRNTDWALSRFSGGPIKLRFD
jgi:hypothetical protein